MGERRARSGLGAAALVLLVVAAGALALGLWASVRVGGEPAIDLRPAMPAIGRRTPVAVAVTSSGRGLAEVVVDLVQGERVERLAQASFDPPSALRPLARGTIAANLEPAVGSEGVAGLREAPATIRVTARAAGTWLREPAPVRAEVTLPVRLHPPAVAVLSSQHYVAQGGAEVVVYRAGGATVRDGVAAGERFFPGFPVPGASGGERFALFAAPYDLADPSAVRLVAVDDAGNEARVAFVDRFFAKPFATDEITVDDAFMARVVPEIMSQTPSLADRGGLLANYLAINGELRRANAAELDALAARSRPAFLWRRPFQPLPGGQVMSAFADRRTYLHAGRAVDRQDHLGYDLASLAHAPVPAANDGVVALARFFGIYGNTVVVDHGFGLMSLYGHLSAIEIGEGAPVRRGDVLGRTGQTGLAGGDHLHFTLVLAGLPVNPVEWWDPHWIADRLARKLGPALPFEPAG